MNKGKNIVGLPVLAYDSGRKLATIKDLLLDAEQRRVLAFLVDGRGWPRELRAIPFGSIKAVGVDALIINNEQAIVQASDIPEVEAALASRTTTVGLRMFTENGRDIGTIEDIFFDEATGEVKGFEVSGNLLTRFRRSRLFVPLPPSMRIGTEVVFVPPETAVRVEEAEQGITPTLEEARTTGEELLQIVSQELEKFGSAASRATAEQQRRFVIGKTAYREVVAPDGTPIVGQGQIIDEPMAYEAERKGVLRELVLAAGTTVARNTFDRLRDETIRAFEEARKSIERWRATRSADVDEVRTKPEEEDANSILGHPVTRAVFDPEQRLIIDAGSDVTRESIQRARQSGVLEELFSAVSKEEPRFTTEERTAHTPGEIRYKRTEDVEGRKSEE